MNHIKTPFDYKSSAPGATRKVVEKKVATSLSATVIPLPPASSGFVTAQTDYSRKVPPGLLLFLYPGLREQFIVLLPRNEVGRKK